MRAAPVVQPPPGDPHGTQYLPRIRLWPQAAIPCTADPSLTVRGSMNWVPSRPIQRTQVVTHQSPRGVTIVVEPLRTCSPLTAADPPKRKPDVFAAWRRVHGSRSCLHRQLLPAPLTIGRKKVGSAGGCRPSRSALRTPSTGPRREKGPDARLQGRRKCGPTCAAMRSIFSGRAGPIDAASCLALP